MVLPGIRAEIGSQCPLELVRGLGTFEAVDPTRFHRSRLSISKVLKMEVQAPLSDDLVQWLNEAQAQVDGDLEIDPVTCPRLDVAAHGEEGGRPGVLVATTGGWVCPHCGFRSQAVAYHPLRASVQLLMSMGNEPMNSSELRGRLTRRLDAYEHLMLQGKPGASEMLAALRIRRRPFDHSWPDRAIDSDCEEMAC